MNIIFVCNEELNESIQGYSLCLLGNQHKFQLQPFGCKGARIYYVITIVGTLVRFEVGQSRVNHAGARRPVGIIKRYIFSCVSPVTDH